MEVAGFDLRGCSRATPAGLTVRCFCHTSRSPQEPAHRPEGCPWGIFTLLGEWNRGDSNSQPSGCKPDALPFELLPLTAPKGLVFTLPRLRGCRRCTEVPP